MHPLTADIAPRCRCVRLSLHCRQHVSAASEDLSPDAAGKDEQGGDPKGAMAKAKVPRRQISRGSACSACARAKTACDTYRPCAHCIRKGPRALPRRRARAPAGRATP